MKAFVTHTSEGRTKVLLEDVSENIECYFSNLGGKQSETHWIFPRKDANDVIESLDDEGYTFTVNELI